MKVLVSAVWWVVSRFLVGAVAIGVVVTVAWSVAMGWRGLAWLIDVDVDTMTGIAGIIVLVIVIGAGLLSWYD